MTVSKPRLIIALIFSSIATVGGIILAAVSHDALRVTGWLLFATAMLTGVIRTVRALRADGRTAGPRPEAG